MERFFGELGDGDPAGGRVALERKQAHHALRVLRLSDGDPIELFDGRGQVAEGVIVTDGSEVMVEVRRVRREPRPTPSLTVASAIPKAGRVDGMVRQLSEVGADVLVPMTTKRSVVNPRQAKLERLRQIAVESAKQCGRAHVLQVAEVATFEQVLAMEAGARLLASAGEDRAWPSDAVASAKQITVLIGPEGGWTDEERAAAEAAGAACWTFGPYVMRIETAAVAAAALLRSGVASAGL